MLLDKVLNRVGHTDDVLTSVALDLEFLDVVASRLTGGEQEDPGPASFVVVIMAVILVENCPERRRAHKPTGFGVGLAGQAVLNW